MMQVVLTLGGVTFQSFEVPEKIVVEGGQRLAVHQLIGGGRVVDVLGDDPGRVSFSGIMSGADAVARAQLLEAATAAAEQLPLFWDSFFFSVIIEDFSVSYEKPWWIPFSLSCVVVVDPLAEIASDVASAATLVANDVTAAAGFAAQAGVALPFAGGATTSTLLDAQVLINAGLGVANGAMNSSAALLADCSDPALASAAIAQVVASAGQVAAVSCMSGYVNRAAANAALAVS